MRTAGVPSPLTRPGNSLRAPVARAPPPVQLLSGASVEQLKLLAAAYKLCPSPTPEQLLAIAERVSIAPEVRDWLAALELAEAVAERNTTKVAAVYADAMATDPPRLLPLLQAFVNVAAPDRDRIAELRRKVDLVVFEEITDGLNR